MEKVVWDLLHQNGGVKRDVESRGSEYESVVCMSTQPRFTNKASFLLDPIWNTKVFAKTFWSRTKARTLFWYNLICMKGGNECMHAWCIYMKSCVS